MQIFILLAGLQEIPGSLYDAAQVEGCNKWELFWKITFPMIGPQIKVCVVYTIIDILADERGELVSYINGLAFRNNLFAQGKMCIRDRHGGLCPPADAHGHGGGLGRP